MGLFWIPIKPTAMVAQYSKSNGKNPFYQSLRKLFSNANQ